MDRIEMVEKLSAKASVSYEEAKQALENNDWDMLDALIELERKGKVKRESGAASYTTEAPREEAKQEQPNADQGGCSWETFWNGFCKLISKGMKNHFVARRNGETIASIPVLVMIGLLIVGFWFILPLLFVGLFFDCRYSFRGSDLGKKNVNDVMGKATDYAEDLKERVKTSVEDEK